MDKEQALEKLSKSYESGSVLFYEGDPANAVWIIAGGKVQLSKRVCSEEIVLETLGAGEFFGEISLLSNCAQNVTATVADNSKLISLDPDQCEALLRSNGELSVRMLKKLAGRLNEAQFIVTSLNMRNPMARVMLHIRRELAAAAAAKIRIPADLPQTLGIDSAELEIILAKLAAKGIVSVSPDNVVAIAQTEEYDKFLRYLELRDRYEYFDKT